jgi:hypothetical protein
MPVPNAFFDYVLRRERLSVMRVVGTMLFKSIQWGPGGERKVPVSLSVTELGRLTGLTRRLVHQAILEAMDRGYIERTKAGRFDPEAGAESYAATYRIRWTTQPVSPAFAVSQASAVESQDAPLPYPFLNESKKGYGESDHKEQRQAFNKGYGDPFNKGYDISIKRSIKNKTTTATGEFSSPPSAVAAAAGGVMAKLVGIGFDETAARHLAIRLEAIEFQHLAEFEVG